MSHVTGAEHQTPGNQTTARPAVDLEARLAALDCYRNQSWFTETELAEDMTCHSCGAPALDHPTEDQKRAARKAAKRTAAIDGLRQLADMLERTPDVDLPHAMGGAVFVELDEARGYMAASPGGWRKEDSGDYWAYVKAYPGNVSFTAYVSRENLCRRVKIGTKEVDAVEAHTEDIFKWECAPADELDAAAE
jgi:hypothetical protein